MPREVTYNSFTKFSISFPAILFCLQKEDDSDDDREAPSDEEKASSSEDEQSDSEDDSDGDVEIQE